jgi:hypothetical protein
LRGINSVIAITVSAGLCSAAVTNGGFESGTGTDADTWNEIEVAGGSLGAIANADRTASNVHTGAWAMRLGVTGAGDFGPVAEIQQQTSVGSVAAGQMYDFSFWAMGTPGPGSVAFYEVLFFDGDGSNGGGPQGSATGLQTFALNSTYTEFGMSGLSAPAGADSVLISIRLVTGAFDGASGEAFIDDVRFSVVPAPSAAALLGLGVVGAMRRRR